VGNTPTENMCVFQRLNVFVLPTVQVASPFGEWRIYVVHSYRLDDSSILVVFG